MVVAGVPVLSGAIAALARRLEAAGQRAFAASIEFAVDAGVPELSLGPLESHTILDALEDCPDDRVPLRDELRRRRGAAAQ